jgi:phytoene dehydrogenase-like protein
MDNDVIIVGGGHNGLVAAAILAKRKLKVTVLEEKSTLGGAVKTERPFAKAPELQTSTGSYLLGVMPPELLHELGVTLPLVRRDPHYFLPTLENRYLLFGSDQGAMAADFRRFFSEQDWLANQAMQAELAQLREDLAPSWLAPPLSLAATAERYIRPALRDIFQRLVTEPVENYLARFAFKSELLVAMYAVTDGFSGLSASFGTPGTGMNFMVHNMCRLPGSDGTFMIVQGGMGTVAQKLAEAATRAGASLVTDAKVERILVDGGAASGVALAGGRELRAKIILCNCDPYRMQSLVGAGELPASLNERLAKVKRGGMTMKVNFALDRLPAFTCLPEDRGQHNSTVHLLPSEPNVIAQLRRGFDQASAGALPDFPSIEWYFHTQADPTMKDAKGRHNSAFFVQWVPTTPKDSTWEREEAGYVKHLCGIAERFAPGFTGSIVDSFTLPPNKIESHFGITGGHIHHVDNTFGFDQRVPYFSGLAGLYSCSAGTHPAGSVVGAAGHNAAQAVLAALA